MMGKPQNRAPAPIQITAEQILRESRERANQEELDDYRMGKRTEFENEIRRQRTHIGTWMKYAKWEEGQEQYERSRSIYERVLDIDYRDPTIWRKYAEFEMRHKCINHARNVWDRAVTFLPRTDKLWYKYAYMEEMLNNRQKETIRARKLFERYCICHPYATPYIRYAKWEERSHQLQLARDERCSEFERALLPKDQTGQIYRAFVAFEKQHGDGQKVDDIVTNKRRLKYEKQIQANASDYDTWLDYIRLEEKKKNNAPAIREIYERAVANVPPAQEKRFWRRYIYLWINYALYEELDAKDIERTRAVYKTCLQLIPHEIFTFAKIWTMFSHFEIRQRDLNAARKILGHAIGRCPKERLFKIYIQLELNLGNAWTRYAELENSAYIDFEVAEGEHDNVRHLFERLLEKATHLKIFISFAEFEESVNNCNGSRDIYKRGYNELRHDQGLPEAAC
eukprot:GSMAST32.ASY1.ANO1.288.1 assembled CDS